MKLKAALLSLIVLGAFAKTPASAQEANVQPPVQATAQQAVQEAEPQKGLKKFDAESFPSVLFTYWEQVAIEDARRSRGLNRAPTDDELTRDLKKGQDDLDITDPGIRDISLSGIAYNGYKNWTIWLNGQRVTPTAIPKEALDLKVFKEYIEIKWFDEYTNRIIPIRLRPHQRFNIDSRIFLPG